MVYRDNLNKMEVNGVPQLFGYWHSSKYLILCRQKKETHTGLEQFEGEYYDSIFSFEWSIPLTPVGADGKLRNSAISRIFAEHVRRNKIVSNVLLYCHLLDEYCKWMTEIHFKALRSHQAAGAKNST